MASEKKSDPIEVYRRVRQVQEWLIAGQSSGDICRSASAQWGISERQAQRYLQEAFEKFKEERNQKFAAKLSYHIRLRMNLYKEAKTAKDLHAALAAIESAAKLEGLHAKTDAKEPGTKVIVKIGGKAIDHD